MSLNIRMVKEVAIGLQEICNEVVFVGGAITEFYAHNSDIDIDTRPTTDVDLVVKLKSYSGLADLEKRLRQKGFKNKVDSTNICKWDYKSIEVDVIPDDPKIVGFSNRWYDKAKDNIILHELSNDLTIRLFDAPYYLATKFEALNDRHGEDIRTSNDFEDIVFIVLHRSNIQDEILNTNVELCNFLKENFSKLITNRRLKEAIECVITPKLVKSHTSKIINQIKNLSIMEPTSTYKRSKFEHFKKCVKDNLDYASNLNTETRIIFSGVIDSIQETTIYQTNPDTYTFTKLKEDIEKIIPDTVISKLPQVDQQRFVNFIKMAKLKPEKNFLVYPTEQQLKEKKWEIFPDTGKGQSKYSFNDFKSQISLPDFMELYGFYDDKRSTSNSRRMKNESTGELYIIKKNSQGYYTFFDPVNEVYKGATVIDFVLDRHKSDIPGKPFTFQDVSKLLTDYIRGELYINPEKSSYKLIQANVDEAKVQKELHGLVPCTNRAFLYSRAITDATIDSDVFKGTVFNHTFYDEINKIEHVNTAFQMKGEKGMVAISKRNENFKGVIGEKSSGIYISRNPFKEGSSERLDKVIIVESAIDALSHYQLNYTTLKDQKIRYISTEGDFSEKQVDVISKVINTQQPKEILFGQDNDLAGVYEITKILSHLKLTDASNNNKNIIGSHVELNTHKAKKDCFVEITLHYERLSGKDEFKQRDEFMEKLLGGFARANDELKGISSEEQPFKITMPFKGDLNEDFKSNNTMLVRVDFNSHHYNWEYINKIVIDTKFAESTIEMYREKPHLKDFNDDLKQLALNHHKDIVLDAKLKGEIDGEFAKVYIGIDHNKQLYKSYDLDFNDISRSDWQPITNEEHTKLTDVLHEEKINHTTDKGIGPEM